MQYRPNIPAVARNPAKHLAGCADVSCRQMPVVGEDAHRGSEPCDAHTQAIFVIIHYRLTVHAFSPAAQLGGYVFVPPAVIPADIRAICPADRGTVQFGEQAIGWANFPPPRPFVGIVIWVGLFHSHHSDTARMIAPYPNGPPHGAQPSAEI